MFRRRPIPLVFALLFVVATGTAAAKQRAVPHPDRPALGAAPLDRFSFSEPAAIATTHLALDLDVDFNTRRLSGTASYRVVNTTGTTRLILDSWNLTIRSVTRDGDIPTTWRLGEATEYGSPLTIDIEPTTTSVSIAYETDPGAPGLFWNSAEQSFGRAQPYLYSLNEPTEGRSWFPSQDTPAARMTYEATLRVPPGMLALMSAEGNPTAVAPDGVYSFRMSRAIPSYLVALAVGRLAFHPFDERTGVYAEPELIDDAALELRYLPEMLDAAERVAGPFPYQRHDVLLMPPTFVVGGMEHPLLNFLNPFSTVSGNIPYDPEPRVLVAHELAHSWAGDSTTLATWDDVWLNEGITSWLAVRILEEMGYVERAEYQHFADRRDFSNYANAVDPSATILHRPVEYSGAGFGATSYVKGSLFMKTLEDRIGRAAFDPFIRTYFRTFSNHWVDSSSFVAFLTKNVPTDGLDLRIDEWLHAPGLPSNITAPVSATLENEAATRAAAWGSGTSLGALGAASWTQTEIDLFLQRANFMQLRMRMAEIDQLLALSGRERPPSSWLLLGIPAKYAPIYPGVERVLLSGGSNGLVLQLYYALVNAGERTRAVDIFNRARKRYSPGVEYQIQQLLGLSSAVGRRAA